MSIEKLHDIIDKLGLDFPIIFHFDRFKKRVRFQKTLAWKWSFCIQKVMALLSATQKRFGNLGFWLL